MGQSSTNTGSNKETQEATVNKGTQGATVLEYWIAAKAAAKEKSKKRKVLGKADILVTRDQILKAHSHHM